MVVKDKNLSENETQWLVQLSMEKDIIKCETKKKCNKHLTFSLSTKIVFLLSINSSLRENQFLEIRNLMGLVIKKV